MIVIILSCLIGVIIAYIFINKKLELFYFSLYYILSLNLILLILFEYSEVVLIYFLNQILEPLIITDPTSFTYNYYLFIINLSFLISTPFLCLLIFYYSSSLYYKNSYFIYKFLNIFLMYMLLITFWISKYNLFLSNWFSLSHITQFNINFDFQPQLELFLNFFWIDYQEFFFLYFILILLPCLIILRSAITYIRLTSFWLNIYLFFFFSFLAYFFFEFLFLNNLLLFVIIWFFLLKFKFLWLILNKSKYFIKLKIKQKI